MATATGTAPSSLTTPPADTSIPAPPTATTTTSTTEPASAAVASSDPTADASPSTTASPMSASAQDEAASAAPAVQAADAAPDTTAVANTGTGAGAGAGTDASAGAAGASAQTATSSSPSTSTPAAPAAAATRTDAPSVNAKQASSSRGSDEKGPSTSSRSTAKSANKKRRKRGGLAGLFVALGCMSSDEFDDDLPPAKVAPSGANRNTAATSSAAATPTTTAAKDATAKDTKDASASSPAAVGAAGAAAVAAGAGAAGAATKSASTPAAAKTENNLNVGTSAVDGVSGTDGAHEAPATPTRGGESVGIGGLAAGGEPTTPPLEETAGLTSGAVQAPGSGAEIIHQHMLHRTESEHHLAGAHGEAGKTESSAYTDEEGLDESGHQEMLYEDEFEDDEDRLIAQGGIGIPLDENGNPAPLLPELVGIDKDRKCLVLDLDETLLHSSFKMLPSADYIVPVEIESQTHNVYVIKRPGVDHFLTEMGKIYEIVVFTASLSKYADPVLDMLDVGRVVRHRLFRESCYNHKGNYVKDLSQLGRDIDKTIIIDNSPASYIFHPNNAVPVSTWFNDPHDTELTDLCPFLADLAGVDDVRGVLDGSI